MVDGRGIPPRSLGAPVPRPCLCFDAVPLAAASPLEPLWREARWLSVASVPAHHLRRVRCAGRAVRRPPHPCRP